MPETFHNEAARTSADSPQIYRFAEFRLDEANRLLTREGKQVSLPARSFDSLLMLVRRHGELVTKAEMMDVVWANSFVEESNLTVAISTLRRALGEHPNDRRLIQTVSGRGYRFIADVSVEERTIAGVKPDEPRVPTAMQEVRPTPEAGLPEGAGRRSR